MAAYWKPVYTYIRLKWGKLIEEAKDLTQGFFVRAIEKDYFRGYEPAKAAFRTYLRLCVDRFVSNEEAAATRIKRGGELVFLPLDFQGAENDVRRLEIAGGENPEEHFHKEWVRSLFGLALEELRAACETNGKNLHFRLFERYDLEDGVDSKTSYEQLAREFGLTTGNVTNYLAWARREFRKIVLEKVREITATDEEFRAEARALLGVEQL